MASATGRRVRQPGIPFVLFTVFLSVLGIGLIIPVLPQLITDLAGGEASDGSRVYGLFVAAYAAMQFLFAPVLGALSDRFGRRPVLLLSVFGAGIDYLVMALAPNLAWLFAARLVAGMTAANITVANAYIADITPATDRARRFGLVGAAFGLGFIVAPALGGLLGSLGLRVPFLAAAGVALLNGLYGLLVLPESLPRERRRPLRLRHANPIGSLRLLRGFPGVGGLATVYLTASLAQALLQAIWVLFTTARFGWGPLENGLALALLGLLTAAMQGFGIRPLLRRWGERRAIVVGLSASAAAYALYAVVPSGAWLLAVMPLGSLGGIAGPALQGLVSRAVPDDQQGSVQGSLAALVSLAAIASPIVATTLFAYFTGPSTPVFLPGAPLVFGGLLLVAAVALASRAARAAQAPAVPDEAATASAAVAAAPVRGR